MARSRRRMTKSPRKRGPRADWVYRPNVLDDTGAIIDPWGSYDPTTKSVTAGVANASLAVLYDSHNYVGSQIIPIATNAMLRAPGRAEGARASIKMVEGTLLCTPSTWAIGSQFQLGVRFGIFPQDPFDGALFVDANYSMWQNLSQTDNIAYWANDRNWQKEDRFDEVFLENQATFKYRWRFPVRRSLKPHECYAVYFETATGSVTVNLRTFFRTLVTDEG